MVDINRFEPMRGLPDDVLAEIVREGEARLQAQLAIATAADQRALTLAGFQIASASASLAGGGALIVSDHPNAPLAFLAMLFSVAMLTAAAFAIRTVRPALFDLPGNSPSGWLPANWMGAGSHPTTLKQARIEQAACLDASIADNISCAKQAARHVGVSIDTTLWTVGVSAAAMLFILAAENGLLGCGWTSLPLRWLPACVAQDAPAQTAPVVYQTKVVHITGSDTLAGPRKSRTKSLPRATRTLKHPRQARPRANDRTVSPG